MASNGWNTCGCNTIYTDAWGGVINGPNSGADGTPPIVAATVPSAVVTPSGAIIPAVPVDSCAMNWGLLAAAAAVGFIVLHLSAFEREL